MGAAVEVPLAGGLAALVDASDVPLVSGVVWHVEHPDGKWPYAVGRLDGKAVRMHRLILGAGVGRYVDHVNGDGLDNRRDNLRLASNRQNQGNRRKSRGDCASVYKGVTLHRRSGKWQAQIRADGRTRYLGLHQSEEQAARAYDEAAALVFGAFARTNFGGEA